MPGVIKQKSVSVPCANLGMGTCPLKSTEFVHTPERPTSPRLMSQSAKNKYRAVSSIPSLYVSQIPPDNDAMNTQQKLADMFGALGDVTEAYFVSPQNEADELSAIVRFSSWTEAEKAFNALKSEDTKCHVNYAKPRTTGEGEQSISPKRLFVGQVPETISEEHLRAYFEQFGPISDISLFKKEKNSPRCAFVEYDSWQACDNAIKASDGKVALATIAEDNDQTVPCKSLVVKYAKAKPISVHCHTGVSDAVDMPRGSPDAYWAASPTQYFPFMFPDPQMYQPFYFAPAVGYFHPMVLPSDGPLLDADSRKIFVGQLPRAVDENHLIRAFGHYGAIESVVILRSEKGRSQGCGFVTFLTRDHAMRAVQEMHGVPFLPSRKPMVVRFASRRI